MLLNNFVMILLLMFLLMAGCRSDTIPEGYDLEGVLLFEEVLSNQTQGYFPDLVALNPETGERFVLTRETLYNVHPSWVAGGDSIIFESKRERDHGAPSHLYILNTRNSRITSLHVGMDLNRMTGGGIQYSRPAVNNRTGRVNYYARDCECIVSQDLNNGVVDTVISKLGTPLKLKWSNDYHYLAVEYWHGRGLDRYSMITVIDSESRVVTTLKDKGTMFGLGDIYNHQLIYRKYKRVKGSTVYLVVLDLKTGIHQIVDSYDRSITDYSSYGNLTFKNERIVYFTIEDSNSLTDIWKMDIRNLEKQQVTQDGKTKRRLTIYRDPL